MPRVDAFEYSVERFSKKLVCSMAPSIWSIQGSGLAAMRSLPIEQYPQITPPVVSVTAFYPGATPEVISQTVAAPLEQQINGVERMIRFGWVACSST